MQVLRSCLQSTSICLQIYTILANKISRHEKKALNTEQPPFFAILGNRVSKAVSKGLIFRMFRQSEKIRKAENPDKCEGLVRMFLRFRFCGIVCCVLYRFSFPQSDL